MVLVLVAKLVLLLLRMWLLVVVLGLLLLLLVIGSGAGLKAVAWRRGNPAVEDAVLTGTAASRSSAATVIGAVGRGRGTIAAILLAGHRGVQEAQLTGLVLLLGLLATQGDLQEREQGNWRKFDL